MRQFDEGAREYKDGKFLGKRELELTTRPEIIERLSPTYSHEATNLRQASEEMSLRIDVYERLFVSGSDWVSGARLLAQSYKDAAKEHEQKACEHLELIKGSRPLPLARCELR